MLLYIVFFVVGLLMCAGGVQSWVSHGELGFRDSVIITLGFSFLVIGMDELIHARRRRQREREGAVRVAH